MKIFFFAIALVFASSSFAQPDTTLPPYKRLPTLPPLQLLLADSTTKFTTADLPKKKPVLIMFFSPDCEHCQHEAEQLVARKEEFKNIQVVMITTYPIYRMNEFVEKYKVTSLDHVVVGRDIYYMLPTFYSIRNFPYLAMYDKKGHLINTMEGTVSLDKILEEFKKP